MPKLIIDNLRRDQIFSVLGKTYIEQSGHADVSITHSDFDALLMLTDPAPAITKNPDGHWILARAPIDETADGCIWRLADVPSEIRLRGMNMLCHRHLETEWLSVGGQRVNRFLDNFLELEKVLDEDRTSLLTAIEQATSPDDLDDRFAAIWGAVV